MTGIDELQLLVDDLKIKGIRPAFININPSVLKVFTSSGFFEYIDSSLIFDGKGTAIRQLFIHLDHDYCKDRCKNTLFMECQTVK
jgi:hypothetical protein